MVVVSHLFSFFDKIRETVPRNGHRLPDLELSFPDSPQTVDKVRDIRCGLFSRKELKSQYLQARL